VYADRDSQWRSPEQQEAATPIKQIQMASFDGQRWQLFGSLINGQTLS
jgi:hypothetical protein